MAKKPFCVPFCNGEHQDYVGYVLSEEEERLCFEQGFFVSPRPFWNGAVEWRPNTPFSTTLSYEGYARGRSSAVFCYKDPDGNRYQMFMTDMDAVILSGSTPISLTGTFEFVKRGMNYGVKLLSLSNG